MPMEDVIIVISCMDRRCNEPVDHLRDEAAKHGTKVIDLRVGGAHVASVEDDLADISNKYNVTEVRVMPHCSDDHSTVKGCGAILVARGVHADHARQSSRPIDRYVSDLRDGGVELGLKPSQTEVEAANYEYDYAGGL